MHRNPGFTLIEMVIAIAITGILAAVVAVFISGPVVGYVDTARRAELTDMADLALKRMALEIRTAVPNSVNVSAAQYVEFIPAVAGGRYCTDADSCPTGKPLASFSTTSASLTFDVLGPVAGTLAANDKVIIYNTGQTGLSAYANDNCATLNNTVTPLSVTGQFPYASPSNRFLVAPASGPIRFNCTASAVQRIGGSRAFCGLTPTVSTATLVSADSVTCSFTYDQVSASNGMLSMMLTLTREGESVTLYHQVHVDNMP